MSKTYLTLCQEAADECEVAGGGPTSVTGQTGQLARIVRYVSESYVEIQNRHVNWRWLRHGFTLTTVADDDTYTYGDCTDTTTGSAITRFREWHLDDPRAPPKVYLQSSGKASETWGIFTSYEAWERTYGIQTHASAFPIHITVDPQNQILLGPPPNGVYVITGYYHRSAQVLAADGDTPEMPGHFHDLIKHYTRRKYGMRNASPELVEWGNADAAVMMADLVREQLPRMTHGVPLA